MPTTSEQELSTALGALKRSHPRITSVVLASPDGRSVGDPELAFKNKLMLTGMCAATIAILKKGFMDHQLGSVLHAEITGDNGSIVLIPSGPRWVLCVAIQGKGGVEMLLPSLIQASSRLDVAA